MIPFHMRSRGSTSGSSHFTLRVSDHLVNLPQQRRAGSGTRLARHSRDAIAKDVGPIEDVANIHFASFLGSDVVKAVCFHAHLPQHFLGRFVTSSYLAFGLAEQNEVVDVPN